VANGDAAHHGSFLMNGTTPVYYAVIPTGSGSIPNAEAVSSHELAEAVTDPDVRLTDTGWSYTYGAWYRSSGPAEIGDGLEGQTVRFTTSGGTYTVQREWSNVFNRGIAPQSNPNGMLDATIPGTIPAGTWNTGGPTVQLDWQVNNGQLVLDWQLSDGTSAGWFSVVKP
jgi:hypothetical protein